MADTDPELYPSCEDSLHHNINYFKNTEISLQGMNYPSEMDPASIINYFKNTIHSLQKLAPYCFYPEHRNGVRLFDLDCENGLRKLTANRTIDVCPERREIPDDEIFIKALYVKNGKLSHEICIFYWMNYDEEFPDYWKPNRIQIISRNSETEEIFTSITRAGWNISVEFKKGVYSSYKHVRNVGWEDVSQKGKLTKRAK